ncbi:NAD-dependent epimerase/dehydratase family protein [Parasphingopyxis sp.]|uniref:NAD-dependent epimerase/dehydratase family protein n=1 Tax=Parasphingopyxis sp. TaxID=1920299 RepID=UPI00260F26B5|nr:NAD-dependent epimerase/dehydratase family protein [Parasphingopyxis sp.]
MRCLIIGSTGPIGAAVIAALEKVGHAAFGLSRSAPADGDGGQAHLIADRSDPQSILAAIRAHRIDTVIDMIVYTEDETADLVNALDGAVARYTMISSCDVYRNYGLLLRRETGEPVREPMTEDAPLRQSRFPYRGDTARAADDPERWRDDYDKIPTEAAVRRFSGEWTILRLPMVYGPGDRQHRFRWVIAPMLAGVETLTVPTAWADWITSYGYIDNVAAAIASAAVHRDATNTIFNIGDYPAESHRHWVTRFAQAIGWTGALEIGPAPESPLAQVIAALNLDVPLTISSGRLSERLRFAPPVPLDEAIARTIAAERAQL